MKFNEKLIKLRKANGYSQENLAEKLGVSRQAISRWEANETTPDIEMLLGICDIFHVSADYLIHDDYTSDEDIPIVKAKSSEIIEVKKKTNIYHLIAAVSFGIASVSSLFGIALSTDATQLAFSCLTTGLTAVLCIFNLYKYTSTKST